MFRKVVKEKIGYYLWYTLFFAIISGCIIGVFVTHGKAFVWAKDGMAQHYPTLIYIHKYLTEFIKNLLSGEFSLPMVDYRIGQGMDVLTTLNYYGFGDPLTLLTALCPTNYMEIMYGILIFLRLYLSGVFFSMYCFVRKQGRDSTVLIGALLYLFSGYGLYASVRHPFFVNGMMFLPLVLIGVERALDKKYGLLAVATGWSMITNFYFTYMNTIVMAMYILFRLIPDKKLTWKLRFTSVFKMMCSYICGILMSGIIAIPVIIAFFGCSRGGEGGYNGSLLHYDLKFYLNFIGTYFFTGSSIGEWTNLSFTVIAFFAILMLWLRGSKREDVCKRNKLLKIAYLILTAMMLIPLAGKIMNGFGYVSNRWNYIYAMLIAYIVVCMMPDIIDLVTFWIFSRTGIERGIAMRKKVRYAFCLVMTGILSLQVCTIYLQHGYLEEFVDLGKANDTLAKTAVQFVSGVKSKNDTDTFFRTEQPWYIGNQSIAMSYYGNNWYFSIAPKSFVEHYNKFQLNAMERTYSLRGLDNRTMLNEVASTRLYASNVLNDGLVPYGFILTGVLPRKDGTTQYLYKNKFFLPLGYTVDSWIPSDEYDKLGCIQKQEALMQGVVLDKKDGEQTDTFQKHTSGLLLNSKKIDYSIKSMSGMTWEDGKLYVTEENATMDISFNSPEKSETYLNLEGIEVIDNKNDYQTCPVTSGVTKNRFVLMNKKKSAWYHNPDITINLGYSYKERKECRITIPDKGIYSLKDISIINQPMNCYPMQAEMLRKDTLQNVNITANTVKGDISLKRTKLMQFSIPYSRGWNAYVDGVEQKIYRSNDMYMAIQIPKGSHDIVLKYKTVGIEAGAVSSVVGTVILFIYVFWQRKQRSRKKL